MRVPRVVREALRDVLDVQVEVLAHLAARAITAIIHIISNIFDNLSNNYARIDGNLLQYESITINKSRGRNCFANLNLKLTNENRTLFNEFNPPLEGGFERNTQFFAYYSM